MKHLFLGCFAMVSLHISAQFTLSGHVLNQTTNDALNGATLQVNDRVLLTDDRGGFETITDVSNIVIVCSFVGFETWTDTLEIDRDTHIDIHMLSTIARLDEAVVDTRRTAEAVAQLAPVRMREIEVAKMATVGQDLGSLLSKVPGVNALTTGASSGQVSIRGVHGSRVAILIDGIPQQNQQWGDDHGTDLDPWMVERVAVYRSGGYVQNGPNASGGSVSLQSAPPLDTSALRLQAFMQGQSVNYGLNGGLRLRKRWKKLEVDASWIERRFGDLQIPADNFEYLTRVLPLFDQKLVNTSGTGQSQRLRVRFDDEDLTWRTELRRSFSQYGIFPGIFGIPSLPALEGDGNQFATELPMNRSEHLAASFAGMWKKGEALVSWQLGVQNSRRMELGPPHGHGFAPLPDDSVALDLDSDAIFAGLSMQKEITKDVNWTLGGQTEWINSRSGGWEFLVSGYQSFNGGAYTGVSGLQSRFGTFGANVRVDAYQLSTDGFEQPIYNSSEELVTFSERSPKTDNTHFGVTASVVWIGKENKHWKWSGQLMRAVRFPNGYEVAANGVHHGTFRHEQGNPNLEPESSIGIELNASHHVQDVTLNISPFVNYYDNYIYLSPSAAFSPLPDAGQLYRFEQNRAWRSGGEVELNWDFASDWSFNSDAAIVFGWNIDKNSGLPWTPPVINHSNIEWAPLNDAEKMRLRFGATAAAPQFNTARNEQDTPGYFVLNAGIQGKTSAFTWSLYANNLLNTPYLNHLSRYRLIDLPEPGFNVGFLIRYQINHS